MRITPMSIGLPDFYFCIANGLSRKVQHSAHDVEYLALCPARPTGQSCQVGVLTEFAERGEGSKYLTGRTRERGFRSGKFGWEQGARPSEAGRHFQDCRTIEIADRVGRHLGLPLPISRMKTYRVNNSTLSEVAEGKGRIACPSRLTPGPGARRSMPAACNFRQFTSTARRFYLRRP